MGSSVSCLKNGVAPGQNKDTDEMNWFRRDSGEKVNYKARLEHKQMMAQSNPEPVYDLIDCGLKTVPASAFSHCRIQRKEVLLLQDNELTSLGSASLNDLKDIKVLDLHNNGLEKLSDDIKHLEKLEVLYLQNNKLKQLPSSIGALRNLKTLNLSHNRLKDLPAAVSGCVSLRTLDLRNNPKLKQIPKEIAHIRCLETLLLDEENITFPDAQTAKQGTEAIMRVLCKECSIEYIAPSQYLPPSETEAEQNVIQTDPYEDVIRAHLDNMEKQKEEKLKYAIAMEKHMVDMQEKEAHSRINSVNNRQKLLDDLAQDGKKLDAEVLALQENRDREREILFNRLHSAEAQADALIKELAESGERLLDQERLMKEMEDDRIKMEKMFTIEAQDVEKLREKEVLRSMQLMMEEEMQREATRQQYEARQEVIQTALTSSLDNDKSVEKVLNVKGQHQKELISSLLEDEQFQRDAFQRLLLQQDGKNLQINDQLQHIQNELASLTQVEMKKRDLQVEFEVSVMKEKRELLTKLLLSLMEQQKKRAEDLQVMMAEMEMRKVEEMDNYWLIQYQKLLDSKPKRLVEAEKDLDQVVKDLLTICGGEELIPLFAKKRINMKQLSHMDHKALEEVGVSSEYMRGKILAAVEETLTTPQLNDSQASAPCASLDGTAPSAPLDDSQASAPPAPLESFPSAPLGTFQSAECVVCLERQCDIIFLPCGHLCCCSVCETTLQQCPLCRADIVQKIKLG